MHTKTLLNWVFALSVCLFVTQALASITFEDASTGNVGITAPFSSGGYNFSYSSDYPNAVHGISNVTNVGASNGSNYLVYASGVGIESFAAGAKLFNLTSLDIGGWENFSVDNNLLITGTRSDHTSVTFNALVKPSTFNTFRLTDFTNLTSVTLGSTPGGAYVAVDNIQVTAVPEPGTYVLMLVGLGLIGAAVKCGKTKQI
jgi:hypothetical protein